MRKVVLLWIARFGCLMFGLSSSLQANTLTSKPSYSAIAADSVANTTEQLNKVKATGLGAGAMALYFPDKQFSNSMFQYTKVFLAPAIELLSFNSELPKDTVVLLAGFDKSYHFIAQGHNYPAIVLGVSDQQIQSIERLRCSQYKVCAQWLYLNSHASPERIRTLNELFFNEKKLAAVAINWSLLPAWQAQLPQIHWLQGQPSQKPFNLIKQALKGRDALLLVPDEKVVNSASIRSILEYAYRNAIPSIGYSQTSYNAGTLLASYANYTQSLLAAKHFMEKERTTWPKMSYVCYQSYYYNETLARSMGIKFDFSLLEPMAEKLNDACYRP